MLAEGAWQLGCQGDAWEGGQAAAFHFPPAVIIQEQSPVAAPGGLSSGIPSGERESLQTGSRQWV